MKSRFATGAATSKVRGAKRNRLDETVATYGVPAGTQSNEYIPNELVMAVYFRNT